MRLSDSLIPNQLFVQPLDFCRSFCQSQIFNAVHASLSNATNTKPSLIGTATTYLQSRGIKLLPNRRSKAGRQERTPILIIITFMGKKCVPITPKIQRNLPKRKITKLYTTCKVCTARQSAPMRGWQYNWRKPTKNYARTSPDLKILTKHNNKTIITIHVTSFVKDYERETEISRLINNNFHGEEIIIRTKVFPETSLLVG